jgi:hypothetical protein
MPTIVRMLFIYPQSLKGTFASGVQVRTQTELGTGIKDRSTAMCPQLPCSQAMTFYSNNSYALSPKICNVSGQGLWFDCTNGLGSLGSLSLARGLGVDAVVCTAHITS